MDQNHLNRLLSKATHSGENDQAQAQTQSDLPLRYPNYVIELSAHRRIETIVYVAFITYIIYTSTPQSSESHLPFAGYKPPSRKILARGAENCTIMASGSSVKPPSAV
ncbi:unnamed protein product [[Candida] boidinii]|nr:unnamed protein product [[Candida] boidinii]